MRFERSRIIRSTDINDLALTEREVVDAFRHKFAPEGLKIIEIGGYASDELVRACKPAIWCSVDPKIEPRDNSAASLFSLDCSSLPFADGEFDLAFASNSFEHIIDLQGALIELRRVLKSGGIAFARFGPIWSGPDGHHLEAQVEGRVYNFWENPILPKWCHLVLDQLELTEMLATKIDSFHAEKISEFCYRSSSLNRIWFDEYLDLFEKSGFEIVELQSIEVIDYPFETPVYRHPHWSKLEPSKVRDEVVKKYGENRNIDCRDISVSLKKK